MRAHRGSGVNFGAARGVARGDAVGEVCRLSGPQPNRAELTPRHGRRSRADSPMATPPCAAGTEHALGAGRDAALVKAVAAVARKSQVAPAARHGNPVLGPLHHARPAWKGEWWAIHPALGHAPRKTEEWPGTASVLGDAGGSGRSCTARSGWRLGGLEDAADAGGPRGSANSLPKRRTTRFGAPRSRRWRRAMTTVRRNVDKCLSDGGDRPLHAPILRHSRPAEG